MMIHMDREDTWELEQYITRSKKFSQKKGFRDGLSYSTPQRSKETRGNAIHCKKEGLF